MKCMLIGMGHKVAA